MKVKNPSLRYGSGVYLIKPVGMPEAVEVFCDMSQFSTDTNRWTVIQRRVDGSEDFNRSWQEYKEGFGSRQHEYWIGNEALHYLADQANYSIRIEIWDILDNYSYADYEDFYVSDESTKYRLFISGYSGNATDAMDDHNRHAFSTKDSDNDASSTHCALFSSAGWWFSQCHNVNPNGKYDLGMTWYNLDKNEFVKLKKVVMKIRQRS